MNIKGVLLNNKKVKYKIEGETIYFKKYLNLGDAVKVITDKDTITFFCTGPTKSLHIWLEYNNKNNLLK